MVEDARVEGLSAGATVSVQKTEQIQLIRRRSTKACPLAKAHGAVRRDTCAHGLALLHAAATRNILRVIGMI